MFTLPTITKIGGEETKLTFREIINRLQQTYCNNIGLDYMFINDRKRCELHVMVDQLFLARGLQINALYRDVCYRLIITLFRAYLCLCEAEDVTVVSSPDSTLSRSKWFGDN